MMDFLEYMADHEHLGTSFKDLQKMTNMSKKQLKEHCWSFNGVIYLTTEEAVITYLKHKAEFMSTVMEPCDGEEDGNQDEWMHINLDNLAKRVKVDALEIPERIKRPKRRGLRANECKCVKNALEELNRVQLAFLGLENFLQPLSKAVNYLSWVNAHNSEIREREKFELMDKSHKSIINQPTKQIIDDMLSFWMSFGCKHGNLIDAYRGLVYRTLWLLSSQMGLMRMDNTYKLLYSDLEYMNVSHYGDVETPVSVELFLAKQQQSKTNRDGAIQYVSCCPHMQPWSDGIGSMAMMLVVKHDLMLLDPPDLKDLVKNKKNPEESFRPWIFDYVFSSVSTHKRNHPFVYLGREFPQTDNSMKWPITLQSISKSFEEAMVKVGIEHQHILHLPRVYGVLRNGINGVTSLETKATGHWQDKNSGAFESAYQLTPMLDTLVKMAGAQSIHDYKPFWASIDPPLHLVRHVLLAFDDVFQHSNERVQLSKRVQAKRSKEWLFDKQTTFLEQFIERLKKLFVQISPTLQKLHKDHVLVKHHKLFKDPTFEKYSKYSSSLCDILNTLNTLMPPLFMNTTKLRFYWDVFDDGNWTLRHSSTSESTQPMISMICSRITTALLATEGDDDGKIPDSTLFDIIRCASFNNVAYEMATWKQFTQKMLLQASCSNCHCEGKHGNSNVSDTSTTNEVDSLRKDDNGPVFPHLTLPLGPNRIEKCWELWTQKTPTLKSVFTEKSDRDAFGSRKEGCRARQAARYIRLTCVALELLEGEISIAQFQQAVVKKKMYISRLGKELAKIFNEMKVSNCKCILAETIKENKNFEDNGGVAYLKECISELLDFDP